MQLTDLKWLPLKFSLCFSKDAALVSNMQQRYDVFFLNRDIQDMSEREAENPPVENAGDDFEKTPEKQDVMESRSHRYRVDSGLWALINQVKYSEEVITTYLYGNLQN